MNPKGPDKTGTGKKPAPKRTGTTSTTTMTTTTNETINEQRPPYQKGRFAQNKEGELGPALGVQLIMQTHNCVAITTQEKNRQDLDLNVSAAAIHGGLHPWIAYWSSQN